MSSEFGSCGGKRLRTENSGTKRLATDGLRFWEWRVWELWSWEWEFGRKGTQGLGDQEQKIGSWWEFKNKVAERLTAEEQGFVSWGNESLGAEEIKIWELRKW